MASENHDFFADIALSGHAVSETDQEILPREQSDVWFQVSERQFPYGEAIVSQDYTQEQRHQKFKEELNQLKKKYMPFMENHLPQIASVPTTELKEFQFRYAKKNEIFMQMEDQDAQWESVTIPDYRGPEGKWKGYYKTRFQIPELEEGERVALHFQSVDYKAKIYVNQNYVGGHEGFFAPFEFDITDYVSDGNELVIEVENDLTTKGDDGPIRDGDKIYAATGPGWDEPVVGWHHCPAGAGIIGKVLVERRPQIFINDIFVRPNIDEGSVELRLGVVNYTEEFPEDFHLHVDICPKNFKGAQPIVYDAEMKVIGSGQNEFRYRIEMKDFRLWELDAPYLYGAVCAIQKDNKTITQAVRHFGMRKFVSDETTKPKGKFFFNNKPIILRGANEMGHLQQCVMNGDLEQLKEDILIAKLCNMNYYRLTQRPVQEEIYDYMDMLGMMNQSDLPLFSTLRRNQAAEAVKQAGEMEHLLRSHPSAVMVTFINEPVCLRMTDDPNSKFSKRYARKGQRHLFRDELEAFFAAARKIIYIENPDRVIKNVEGDYDPPTKQGMPDFHTYTMWYSHHPIPVARLAKGYIPPVKQGWMIGCGEYGAEGLDHVDLMLERYPKEWLEKDKNGDWYPTAIVRAQMNAMHGDWFKEQRTMEDWVRESQIHQAEATKTMTEAFRRRADYIGHTAIHLLIDAWPAGWMKTLVSCDRVPKLAYYAYADALIPYRLNLYCDRSYVYEGETVPVEVWLLNDTSDAQKGRAVASLSVGGKALYSYESEVSVDAAYSTCSGRIPLQMPHVDEETVVSLDAALYNQEEQIVHAERLELIVYPRSRQRQTKVFAMGVRAAAVTAALGYVSTSAQEADTIVTSCVEDCEQQISEALSAGKNAVVILPDIEQRKFQIGALEIETKKGPKVYFAAQSEELAKDYHMNRLYSETTGYREFVGRKYIMGDEGTELIYTYAKSGADGVKVPKLHLPFAKKYQAGKGTLYVISLILEGKLTKNPNLDEFLSDCIEGSI